MGGTNRTTGMSEKKSGLEKLRGAGRKATVAEVVMAAAVTRTMKNSVRKARVMHM